MDHAELSFGGETIKLPVVTGTENEKAVDISKLRAETGTITLDPGYVNTGSCESAITFINGEKGILRHRGYSIESLCEKADFLETAYLLVKDALPNQEEYDTFRKAIANHANIHEKMTQMMATFPSDAHPMVVLMAAVSSLSAFFPYDTDSDEETEEAIVRFLGKMPVIAAMIYRTREGLPLNYPDENLGYAANFLKMMFDSRAKPYDVDPDVAKTLDLLLTLHADHEQNCSAATVRMVGSSQANLYASVTGGICSLWGPLHGGANQKVLEMLHRIHKDGGDIQKYLEMAKDKTNNFRLMGFGHRVYKNFDPRARIIKKSCDAVLDKMGVDDPLLDIAKRLEKAALQDSYFVDRKLYPNVDFYSGIIYRALGIPTDMFTVMFAIGRLPGWIAQWKEMRKDPRGRIGRPRQIYQGEVERELASKVTKHYN